MRAALSEKFSERAAFLFDKAPAQWYSYFNTVETDEAEE